MALRHARAPRTSRPTTPTSAAAGRRPRAARRPSRRYDAIGGISPLPERTEAQRRRCRRPSTASPGRFEVVLGLKHAAPFIEAAVAELAGEPASRLVGLVLAPHFSAFSVGEYLERAVAAGGREGVAGPRHPQLAPRARLPRLPGRARSPQARRLPTRTKVLFTAHSLPQRILATGDPYPDQLPGRRPPSPSGRAGAVDGWCVAWQCAGRTPEPWLGPRHPRRHRRAWPPRRRRGVLVCACGFVADHLEVLYDLDIEARRRADGSGWPSPAPPASTTTRR